MEFFLPCMESVFDAMNVRRSGPDDDKETYVDMTMMVEIPNPDLVAAIDVSLVALLFDNARMAVKQATPSSQVHFPRQDIAFATELFEDVYDNCVAVHIDTAGVKVKTLYPADDDGNGATMKLQFSFVIPEKRVLALLAELIGEPVWFIGSDSTNQEDPGKKKPESDDIKPLKGQEKLFPDGKTVEVKRTKTSAPKKGDAALRVVK